MVTFTLEEDGTKTWFVIFNGITLKCANKDVADDLGKLLRQGAVKVVV